MTSALEKALGGLLPPGFKVSADGDFIDHGQNLRVIRLIGPGRSPIMFQYPKGPNIRVSDYDSCRRLVYLDAKGDLIEFDPDKVSGPLSWGQNVAVFLTEQGAPEFRGHGWAEECASVILTLVRRWQDYHNRAMKSLENTMTPKDTPIAIPDDLDELTRSLSAFSSFNELLNAGGNYRPTIHVEHSPDHLALAVFYDAAQKARGDERRTYRARG